MSGGDDAELEQEPDKCGFCGSLTFRVYEDDGRVVAIECAVCGEVYEVD